MLNYANKLTQIHTFPFLYLISINSHIKVHSCEYETLDTISFQIKNFFSYLIKKVYNIEQLHMM